MKLREIKGRATNTQNSINPKPFQDLGNGHISACGTDKKQDYKGWITITETIPKGSKVHVLAYKQTHGLSLRLGKPKL